MKPKEPIDEALNDAILDVRHAREAVAELGDALVLHLLDMAMYGLRLRQLAERGKSERAA